MPGFVGSQPAVNRTTAAHLKYAEFFTVPFPLSTYTRRWNQLTHAETKRSRKFAASGLLLRHRTKGTLVLQGHFLRPDDMSYEFRVRGD